jgi:hypothetical protein
MVPSGPTTRVRFTTMRLTHVFRIGSEETKTKWIVVFPTTSESLLVAVNPGFACTNARSPSRKAARSVKLPKRRRRVHVGRDQPRHTVGIARDGRQERVLECRVDRRWIPAAGVCLKGKDERLDDDESAQDDAESACSRRAERPPIYLSKPACCPRNQTRPDCSRLQ